MAKTIISFMSLKFLISLVAFALIALGGGLSAYFVAHRLSEGMQASLEAQQFSTASYIASDLDGKMRLRTELIEQIAANISSDLVADPQRMQDFLKVRFALLKLFKGGMTVINKNGLGVTDYPPLPGRADANFSDTDYFLEVMETLKTVVGKPLMARYSKVPGVVIAAPILDEFDGLVGVLAGLAIFSDETLFGQVLNTKLGKSGYIVIDVPKYRLIAASSDPSRVLSPMAAPGVNLLLDRFVAGYEGSGVTINSRGVETLSSAKRIPSTGWLVQLVLPTKEAFAPIREMRLRIYLLTIGISLTISAALWLAIKYLFAPLELASQRVAEMSTGQRTLEVLPIKRRDELGRLLDNFNALVLERKVYEEQLRQAKEQLEVRVQERTSELSDNLERLRLAKEQAESANRMKVNFLANVSHELRTPLNPIIAFSELTLQSTLSDDQRENLLEIRKAARHLEDMVNELIKLTGMDIYEMRKVEFSPQSVLNVVVHELHSKAGAKGIDLIASVEANVPAIIYADFDLILLVIRKIAENAVKFTTCGKITLSIGHVQKANGEQLIRFSVADTGIGIAAEEIESIAHGFTQSEAPLTKRFAGLGLGLAAVHKALELLGGYLDIESEKGRGSVFRVYVPLHDLPTKTSGR